LVSPLSLPPCQIPHGTVLWRAIAVCHSAAELVCIPFEEGGDVSITVTLRFFNAFLCLTPYGWRFLQQRVLSCTIFSRYLPLGVRDDAFAATFAEAVTSPCSALPLAGFDG